MRTWGRVEWPERCIAAVITPQWLIENDYGGELKSNYLLIVRSPADTEFEFECWVQHAGRVREYLQMAAPARVQIQHGRHEDVSAMENWFDLDNPVH